MNCYLTHIFNTSILTFTCFIFPYIFLSISTFPHIHVSNQSPCLTSVDCVDPSCRGHGWCVEGRCVCRAGWTDANCSTVDHKVFTCLPDCSGHGHYDLHTSACVCETIWTGPDCSEGKECLLYFRSFMLFLFFVFP